MSPTIGRIEVCAFGCASGATMSCSVSLVISRLPIWPSLEEPLGELAADHAGRAGDENMHRQSLLHAPLVARPKP